MATIECQSCHAKELKTAYLFCPFCGERLIKAGLCIGCGYQNDENAYFCQECGQPLDSVSLRGKKVTLRPPSEKPGPPSAECIVLEFGHSSSSNHELAVNAAMKLPNFEQFGEGKRAIFRVTLRPEDIQEASELVGFIRGWKSSRVYLEGEKTTWDAVFRFKWCYERRQASFKPDLYCFGYENEYDINLWGCIQARMPYSSYAEWLTWGKWLDKRGTWQFDKDRIRHKLQQELYEYRFCPAFNTSLVEDVLNTLPVSVNPTKNKNWDFIEDWSGGSGVLAITVMDHGYRDKVYYKGVAPKKAAIQEMIRILNLRLPKSFGQ